ncbi:hypothetical protein SUGI_1504960 [Cryptomeria japonica]|uniref:Uncharacterized protein n=1 Tax=Cryptomeria japonica TaxID=3369 RepID=A0AAD3NTD9_CRYJA|nr:hypothetical protein SUGI_1222810 [Cryptomeria japonica]GLJ59361.1 hypothetical protein SUGI_1504960 [Cryptomeria japonica]
MVSASDRARYRLVEQWFFPRLVRWPAYILDLCSRPTDRTTRREGQSLTSSFPKRQPLRPPTPTRLPPLWPGTDIVRGARRAHGSGSPRPGLSLPGLGREAIKLSRTPFKPIYSPN